MNIPKIVRPVALLLIPLFVGQPLFAQTEHPEYHDGWLYVKVAPSHRLKLPEFDASASANSPDVATLFSQEGYPELGQILADFEVERFENAAILQDPDLQQYYKLHTSEFGQILPLRDQLQQLAFVELAERKELMKRFFTPNDFGVTATRNWHLQAVRAEQAWDLGRGDTSVVIAITDDAVMLTHEDIGPELWNNSDEIPGNGVDDDNDGFTDNMVGWDVADNDNDPSPPSGNNNFSHGSYTSSTAAAATNNGKGIASIGFNCRLMAVKSTSSSGSPQAIPFGVDGVQAAAQMGADIINMSWGSSQFSSFSQQVMQTASNTSLLVAAAGNNNTDQLHYPAAFSTVIAVGATSTGEQRAQFSNFGNWVDCMAPGIILSADASGVSEYRIVQGTSFSSPMVAGLLGLMKSLNPNKTNSELTSCLLNSADNIDGQNPGFAGQLGFGEINAEAALKCVRPVRCDTSRLSSHLSSANSQLVPASSLDTAAQGFVAGTNSTTAQAVAQNFADQPGYNLLTSIDLGFGRAVDNGTADSVQLRVWDADGPNDAPGSVLWQGSVPLAQIQTDIQNQQETRVTFSSPLSIPSNFYIGMLINQGGSDSLALLSTPVGQSSPGRGYERDSSSWQTMSQNWGQNIDLAIYPNVSSTDVVQDPDFNTDTLPGMTLQFTAQGPSGNQYLWEFGDGSAGTGQQVQHQFDTTGQFPVSLFVDNGKCQTQTSDTVSVVEITGREDDLTAADIRLFPNPSDAGFQLRLPQQLRDSDLRVSIHDLQGRSLWQTRHQMNSGQLTPRFTPQLPAGLYLVRLQTPEGTLSLRWTKLE